MPRRTDRTNRENPYYSRRQERREERWQGRPVPPSIGNDGFRRTRPVDPSNNLPVLGRHDQRPAHGTWETSNGTVVHRDRYGNISFPNRSPITDIHNSNTGKSWVVERGDGMREIHNRETGRVTYAHRPASENSVYNLPPSARRINYSRREFNYTNITINETNIYLKQKNYYVSEPIFYEGYRWRPPVFAPVLLAAGATLLTMDALYNATYYPKGLVGVRDSVANMTGANWYAGELNRAGIYDSYDLLAAGRTPEQRSSLAAVTGIPYSEVRKAVGQADLMRVYGIGPHNSRLLVDAGIESVQDLARYSWDPVGLYNQLQYSSFWDAQRAPSLSEVESWIAQARNLPVAVYDDGSQQPSVPGGGPMPPPIAPPPPPPPVYIPPARRSSW